MRQHVHLLVIEIHPSFNESPDVSEIEFFREIAPTREIPVHAVGHLLTNAGGRKTPTAVPTGGVRTSAWRTDELTLYERECACFEWG